MKVLITEEDFDSFLKDAGDALVVIDFYADWCGPCKMITPKLEAMEKEFGNVRFGKVNVDDNEEVATKQGINAMPTFYFFKNGEKVDSVTGANEGKIRETIQAHM